jgi:hypothetical protein
MMLVSTLSEEYLQKLFSFVSQKLSTTGVSKQKPAPDGSTYVDESTVADGLSASARRSQDDTLVGKKVPNVTVVVEKTSGATIAPAEEVVSPSATSITKRVSFVLVRYSADGREISFDVVGVFDSVALALAEMKEMGVYEIKNTRPQIDLGGEHATVLWNNYGGEEFGAYEYFAILQTKQKIQEDDERPPLLTGEIDVDQSSSEEPKHDLPLAPSESDNERQPKPNRRKPLDEKELMKKMVDLFNSSDSVELQEVLCGDEEDIPSSDEDDEEYVPSSSDDEEYGDDEVVDSDDSSDSSSEESEKNEFCITPQETIAILDLLNYRKSERTLDDELDVNIRVEYHNDTMSFGKQMTFGQMISDIEQFAIPKGMKVKKIDLVRVEKDVLVLKVVYKTSAEQTFKCTECKTTTADKADIAIWNDNVDDEGICHECCTMCQICEYEAMIATSHLKTSSWQKTDEGWICEECTMQNPPAYLCLECRRGTNYEEDMALPLEVCKKCAYTWCSECENPTVTRYLLTNGWVRTDMKKNKWTCPDCMGKSSSSEEVEKLKEPNPLALPKWAKVTEKTSSSEESVKEEKTKVVVEQIPNTQPRRILASLADLVEEMRQQWVPIDLEFYANTTRQFGKGRKVPKGALSIGDPEFGPQTVVLFGEKDVNGFEFFLNDEVFTGFWNGKEWLVGFF